MATTRSPSPTKRGQVSTVDFIVGLLIMTSALIIVSNLILTLRTDKSFERLREESQTVADTLLSEGYPPSWNGTTLIKAGLLSQGRLNTTKLEILDNLTYDELKQSLGPDVGVYWYFANASGVVRIGACGYGDPSIMVDTECLPTIDEENNIIRTDRLLAYNGRIIHLVIMTWD